jgi:hypothetical protein
MATNYGTLQVLDTIAANAANQTVAAFGEDRIWDAIRANLDAHNEIVREVIRELCDFSTDRQRRYGGVQETEMIEADEFGTADAQKITAGVTVGFPLRNYQYAVQWTRMYMQTRTVAEFDAQYVAARTADIKNIRRQISRALFTPTNNLTYVDRYVDNVTLPVRALVNADGTAIPNDPYGQSFDGSTHTHYLAINGITEGAVLNLIETVIEHGFGGGMRLFINRAQENAIRGFAGFAGYTDPRIIPADNTVRARGDLNQTQLYNRPLGVFGAAEVWVKPWIPSGYLLAMDVNSPLKPLVFRTRDGGQLGNLAIAAEHEHYPIRAQHMDREFGIGVWNRTNGAVLYVGSGTYTAPVF